MTTAAMRLAKASEARVAELKEWMGLATGLELFLSARREKVIEEEGARQDDSQGTDSDVSVSSAAIDHLLDSLETQKEQTI